jgi:hypothetical protein
MARKRYGAALVPLALFGTIRGSDRADLGRDLAPDCARAPRGWRARVRSRGARHRSAKGTRRRPRNLRKPLRRQDHIARAAAVPVLRITLSSGVLSCGQSSRSARTSVGDDDHGAPGGAGLDHPSLYPVTTGFLNAAGRGVSRVGDALFRLCCGARPRPPYTLMMLAADAGARQSRAPPHRR